MERKTGYPSIERPWEQYYTQKKHNILSPDMSMYRYLLENSKKHLDAYALNYFGNKTTFRQLFERIDSVANALEGYGIHKGDVVSLCPLNTPEFVYLFYALNKIGAVSNWIGLNSPVEDLHEEIDSSESRIVFTVSLAYEQISEAAKDTKVESIITVPIENSMPVVLKALLSIKYRHVNNAGVRWKDFIRYSGAGREENVNPDETVMLIYTGGSTGVPKGVMLSNKALNSYYVNFSESNSCGVSSYNLGDSFISGVPFFLAFGVSSCCHGPLCHGMELLLAPDPNPKAGVDLILRYKPNHIAGGPPMVDLLAEMAEKKRTDLSFIKSIIYGGETANRHWEIESAKRLKERNADVPILNGYGMTETAAAILIAVKNLPGLLPLCNVNVMVTDPEDYKTELGYDEEGELLLSSETLMIGYFGYKEETDDTLVWIDGTRWIRTNDLARISEDGTVKITGRIKRIYYKLDADNVPLRVYPMRTESVIEGVLGVGKCAVVGVHDDITAYRSVAYIILSDKTTDNGTVKERIDVACKESLPNNHWPDEYIFIDEFPITRAGKVDYRKLEEMAQSN